MRSLSQKVKYDIYSVYGKKREYKIILFPSIRNMWAYDGHPGEDILMIDGDKDALTQLKYAFAILANEPYKIIYFPIRNEGYKDFYKNNYNLVLLRPELQFRRSEWFLLKRRIDKKHWCGKYVFSYCEDKMDNIWQQMQRNWRKPDIDRKNQKQHVEEIIGETLFMVIPREMCYEIHGSLKQAITDSMTSREISTSYLIGWVMNMKEDTI